MTPIAGYKVIPDGWSEHHRPVAESTMTADCVIVRAAGPPPYPLPDGWTGETQVWAGKCRLQELKREAAPVAAEQPVNTRQYLVTIPYTPGLDIHTGETGDTVIVAGRRYTVAQQMYGSEVWEWDLICVDNLTQNREAS
ncbi:DUF6093 family protein [Zhihengliuella flava]|uniref:Uncharacterized protein n=1 Tax=Zhihengliuella flava TaxID=1285193 RepID=A0A931GGH7_9MICC|nr:DUF6093 family protein [Zhihengliuella flava]MBG6085817.1 hypothetical protein [Zhihengliuella flava]